MKITIVGRHSPDMGEGYEVIKTENTQWPATAAECISVLNALLKEAYENDSLVVLQTVPGQLAAALAKLATEYPTLGLGIIVSKPGPREAGVSRDFQFGVYEAPTAGPGLQEEAARLARFCNGRAKVEKTGSGWEAGLRVTVDPIPSFKFSHIEWL